MIKKCTFFLITMLLISSTLIHGKETLLISERDFKTLIPDMTVSINRILDDGTLLCIGEPGKGKNLSVFIIDPQSRKIMKKMAVPSTSIDYMASDEKGGKIILFCCQSHTFYLADMAAGTCRVLFKREKGKPGFDLFSHGKSFLTFTDDKAIAWGYFYDDKMMLEGEYLTEIDPSQQGAAVFLKLLSNDELKKMASQYSKKVEKLGTIRVNRDFLVFSSMDKKGSTLIAYAFKEKEHFQIDASPSLMGVTIARNAALAACISKKDEKKEGSLQLFNLKDRKSTTPGRGKLLNPVFSPDAGHLAVGVVKIGNDRKLGMDISLYSLKTPEKAPMLLAFEKSLYLIDWKFVKGDSGLILLTGKEVYYYKLR
ncbi:MAG: hypothetical protein AB9903_04995 [Vulcanimicrobiota bacterium]